MQAGRSKDDNGYETQGLLPLASLGEDERGLLYCIDDGILLSIAAGFGCLAVLYSAVISKMLPSTGLPVLDAIREDYYYCVLVPLLGIPLFLFSYLNWLSFKLFRHN